MIERLHCSVLETYAQIVAHQVNCMGVMGSGVAAQVKQKYPDAYKMYKDLCDEYSRNRVGLLGKAQLCPVSFLPDGTPRIYVANLFGQYKYGKDKNTIYTNYVALRQCMNELSEFAIKHNHIIAMPFKIGCDRGNGDWNHIVYPMIKRIFAENNVLICEYGGR